jgi:hypothetical protein
MVMLPNEVTTLFATANALWKISFANSIENTELRDWSVKKKKIEQMGKR